MCQYHDDPDTPIKAKSHPPVNKELSVKMEESFFFFFHCVIKKSNSMRVCVPGKRHAVPLSSSSSSPLDDGTNFDPVGESEGLALFCSTMVFPLFVSLFYCF